MEIFTNATDKVYLECDCGYDIISIFRNYDEFYIQYYGDCKDRQPDFIFNNKKDFIEFINYLKAAVDYSTNNYCDDYNKFQEIEIGAIINEYKKKSSNEALYICADNGKLITISKYHKHIKKFIRLYKNKYDDEVVAYKDCKSDWNLLVDADVIKEFIKALEKMLVNW